MTRSRIKFEGKFYKVVPWIERGECNGCHFWKNQNAVPDCPNQGAKDQFCDEGGEFHGKIFIEHGKEALAQYIADKLDGEP